MKTTAFGVTSKDSNFNKLDIIRNEPGPQDVLIQIEYCGICHSDIHTARSEWGPAHYPCVPGHEIVGKVLAKGSKVKKFKVGQPVGVGCFVNSCGKCNSCKANEQQFCSKQTVFTYNSLDKSSPAGYTMGGYSRHITVNEKYVLKISDSKNLDRIAPLLCAGVTTYSPLKKYKVKKGMKVAVVGLGGLGHMAVKIAKAMGAEVSVISTSKNKELDAIKLGAKKFILSNNSDMDSFKGYFHLIIDTVSAEHSLAPLLTALQIDGTLVLLGAPPTPHQISAFSLIGGRKKITGSLIGGINETQEMLNFCHKKKIFADIELINSDQIDTAYDRTLKGQVKYRFVIDAKTFEN